MSTSDVNVSTQVPTSSIIDLLGLIKWTKILFDGQKSDIQYGDIEIDRTGAIWVSGQIISSTDDYRYPILGEGAVTRISPYGTDSINYNLGRNGISRYIVDLVDSPDGMLAAGSDITTFIGDSSNAYVWQLNNRGFSENFEIKARFETSRKEYMQRVFDTSQGLRAFVYQNNYDNNSWGDYSNHGWLYSETLSSWYLPEFGSQLYLGAYTDLEIRDTGEVIYVDRQKITSLSNLHFKIWEKSLDQFLPSSSGYPYYARGVELGVDGSVYCILEYKNILSGDFDSCLIRIDSDGEATFSKNLGGNWIEDFKTDKSGNVYIVSRTRSGWNSIISKIDKTGVTLCEAPLGFLASRIRIAIDASESIYLYSSTTDSRVIGRASDSFVPFVSKVVLPLSSIPKDVSHIIRGNSLYTIVDGPSWTQAEANSVKLGGHLATINTAGENAFLVSSYPMQTDWFMYWIGLNDASSEGVYNWSSGESSTYFNWRPTSGPNRIASDASSLGPSYIEFQVNDLNESSAGQWNDTSVNAFHLGNGPGIAETPFTRRGDSAYVIVQGPTWEEAEANAVKLGGHLVTINDDAENEWISAAFGGNTLSGISGGFIGLKELEEGNWKWVDGSTSGYRHWFYDTNTPWNPQEPNNYGGKNEQYGIMYFHSNPGNTGGTIPPLGWWGDGLTNNAIYGIAEIKLAPNNPLSGTPTLSGTLKAGQVISIDGNPIQDADNFTGYTPDYNYSFEVSSDNGTTWTKLTTTDATDNNTTYTLTSADVGKQVRGVVSYLDGYGTNESVTSDGSILVIGNQAPTDISPSTTFINFNSKAGSAVLSLSTTDPDVDGSFTYALVAGTGGIDNAAFTLTSNQLSIKAVPVPSKKKTYSIRVRSTDQGGLSVEKSLNLSLNFAPTALSSSTTSFSENINSGSVVSTLSSTDPDPGNTFTYSLVTGTGSTDNASFSIDSNQLKINTSPDFETKAAYSVRVRTTDQSGLFFEKSISLAVANVNEAPIGISASTSNFNENIAAGSVVATLASTDPDKSSTFTYTLVTGAGSTDNVAFSIRGNQLKIKASPDYETKSSYNIRVQTKDQGGLTFEKNLTFTVNDLDEAPTNITSTSTSFNENIFGGTAVATLGSTSSSSASIFTYALVIGTGSTDNGAFTISGNQLRISGSPDFETKSSYSIRVQTKDQAGLAFEKSFVFTVNNLNEAPTALTVSSTNFNENIAAGSVVANLTTIDPDASNSFTYSLVAGTGSNDNGAYSISGNQLKIIASPDYEAKSSYQIRVRTTDQGGLTFFKDVVLSVNNLVEKVSSSASTTLAPNKDTLELTRTKNIFGTGNQFDNAITGNLGKNKLTGGLGKDILTGGGGIDIFFYSSLKDSLLPGFDVITDYATGEKISTGFDFEGDDLIDSTGMVSDLNAAAIGSVLTNTTFLANNASAFTVEGLTGTFLALNDGRDGFQADSDTLIHLSNYTIGSYTPISIM